MQNGVGITIFDVENDSMTSINASRDKSKWLEMDLKTATECKEQTGWEILEECECIA